jgi:hypothetical protein
MWRPKRNKKIREIALAEFSTACSLHGGEQMELESVCDLPFRLFQKKLPTCRLNLHFSKNVVQ